MNAFQYTTYGHMKVLCGGDDMDLKPLPPSRSQLSLKGQEMSDACVLLMSLVSEM